MKKSLLLFFIVVLCLSLSITACKKQEQFNLGTLVNNTYSNEYFGLSFQLPDDWVSLDDDEIAELDRLSREMIAESNKELGKKLDDTSGQYHYLAFSTKYPENYSIPFNPNFICMVEKLGPFDRSKVTAEFYLVEARDLMKQTGFSYVFDNIGSETVGSQEFSVMITWLDLEEIVIEQKYYATIIKDYVFCFILSYTTVEELTEMEVTVHTLTFN